MGLTKISTDGVKDDAITSGKIPANAVGASELADNAVDTNAIANNAVTAGKTSGVQTTINQNASDRVITGSSTANNLNAQSGLTYNGLDLNISNDVPQLLLTDNNSNSSIGRVRGNAGNLILSADTNNATAGSIINFEIDGSEQARITASTNIGIGTTTPTAWGSGIPTVEFKGVGNTSRGGAIAFESQSGSNGYNVIYSDAGDLRIYTGATNRASATEKVMFPRTGGITFNGDTATANALDDYEEGTWTPQIAYHYGTVTSYASQIGKYTKIGNMVYADFYVQLSDRGNPSGSYSYLTNLPFNHTGSTAGTGVINYFNNLNYNVSYLSFELGGSSPTVAWLTGVASTSASSMSYLSGSYYTNNSYLQGTLIYRTSG